MKKPLVTIVAMTTLILVGCSGESEPNVVTTTVTTTNSPLAPRFTTETAIKPESQTGYGIKEPVAIQSCQLDAIEQIERSLDQRGEFININTTERSWGWSITMDLEFLGDIYSIDCTVNTSEIKIVTSSIVSAPR